MFESLVVKAKEAEEDAEKAGINMHMCSGTSLRKNPLSQNCATILHVSLIVGG